MPDIQKFLELLAKIGPIIEKLRPIIDWLTKLIGSRPAPGRPGPGAGSGVPGDEDVPNPTQHDRVPTGIKVSLMRIVLNGTRFPNADPMLPDPGSYDGGANAIPWNSKVTIDSELWDDAGGIPVQEGSPLSHSNVFKCQKVGDREPAIIGPGTGEKLIVKSSASVGAGGKNYDESHGMIATFRLPVEGDYDVWVENGNATSRAMRLRTS